MELWCLLWNFGAFYETLVSFMDFVPSMELWCILCNFGAFYWTLVPFIELWCLLLNFGVFYGTLVPIMELWCLLWNFGAFYETLVHFMELWCLLWYECPLKFTYLVHSPPRLNHPQRHGAAENNANSQLNPLVPRVGKIKLCPRTVNCLVKLCCWNLQRKCFSEGTHGILGVSSSAI